MDANRVLRVSATAICAGTLFLPSSALSQRTLSIAEATPNEQRVALVIGNAAYDADLRLKNPVNDASDLAAVLRELDFKVVLVTDADRRQMRASIRDFVQTLKRGGVGLFYFAGHGIMSRGKNFLVPVKADVKEEFDLEDQAIDTNTLLAGMEEASNRVNILILDACRNNPFGRTWRSASQGGLAQLNAPAGSFIAFATSPGAVAADGAGRNSVFTKHLLINLRFGESAIDRVFTRVISAVAEETRKQQVPWQSSSLSGIFKFRPSEQLTIPSQFDLAVVELSFWESIKASTNPDDFKAYLAQYPKGRFAALAETRIAADSNAPTQLAATAPSAAATRPSGPLPALAGMAPGTSFKDCDVCPEMIVIPAGNYLMGSPESEPQRESDEGPQRRVTIARPFAAGKYEVTFDEWDVCARESGCNYKPADSGWGRGKRPAIRISWDDAMQYVAWLSRKAGKNYRLLSEAEWEYVARAGSVTAFNTGSSISPMQANYDARTSYAGSPTATTRGQTVPVGRYAANAFGLHDVHGNVSEWVEDCWNSSYRGAPSDGSCVVNSENSLAGDAAGPPAGV